MPEATGVPLPPPPGLDALAVEDDSGGNFRAISDQVVPDEAGPEDEPDPGPPELGPVAELSCHILAMLSLTLSILS